MSTVTISKHEASALQRSQWVRNAKYPDASLYSFLSGDLNRVIRYQTKEVFHAMSPLGSIKTPSSGTPTTQQRWRGAFHASPFSRYLVARVIMAMSAASTSSSSRHSTLTLSSSTTYASTLATAEFHYGSTAGSILDTPNEFGILAGIPVDSSGVAYDLFLGGVADSDLYLLWEDFGARLISATVYELSVAATTENGYLKDSFTAFQPIFDTHRQGIVNNATSQCKGGGPQLICFTVERDSDGAISSTSATAKNVVDNSTTAVSAASPGYTLDLTNRARVGTGTVPCVFKAFAKKSAGTAGTVVLKNSAGSVLATVSVTSTTAQWFSTTVNLPATSAKYDIQYAGDGTNTNTVYAASLYRDE